MRVVVMSGSTMTRSPFFVVPMNSRLFLYCSPTSGLMLLLNPPVPRPIMRMARIKHASAASFFSITPGTDDTMSSACPTMATPTETQMVLKRPQYVSAT